MTREQKLKLIQFQMDFELEKLRLQEEALAFIEIHTEEIEVKVRELREQKEELESEIAAEKMGSPFDNDL